MSFWEEFTKLVIGKREVFLGIGLVFGKTDFIRLGVLKALLLGRQKIFSNV